eukprot:CAMPEP_0182423544 /NCGR_PEP_ID=MMETSP1167-20130531/9586_1 /TAXON_ID=2988 /ORGANISM="Mallomonas Sp, Strain CCMP3275" /LENGTH=550 /DNA_ID=CAMNT_0024602631 /DNA_START=187 /DNA_END=1839 /DNA_ORIENTATION=+
MNTIFHHPYINSLLESLSILGKGKEDHLLFSEFGGEVILGKKFTHPLQIDKNGNPIPDDDDETGTVGIIKQLSRKLSSTISTADKKPIQDMIQEGKDEEDILHHAGEKVKIKQSPPIVSDTSKRGVFIAAEDQSETERKGVKRKNDMEREREKPVEEINEEEKEREEKIKRQREIELRKVEEENRRKEKEREEEEREREKQDEERKREEIEREKEKEEAEKQREEKERVDSEKNLQEELERLRKEEEERAREEEENEEDERQFAEEEEGSWLADQQKKRVEEEERAALLAEEEAQAKRLAEEEAETKRLAEEEAEAKRLQEEAEARIYIEEAKRMAENEDREKTEQEQRERAEEEKERAQLSSSHTRPRSATKRNEVVEFEDKTEAMENELRAQRIQAELRLLEKRRPKADANEKMLTELQEREEHLKEEMNRILADMEQNEHNRQEAGSRFVSGDFNAATLFNDIDSKVYLQEPNILDDTATAIAEERSEEDPVKKVSIMNRNNEVFEEKLEREKLVSREAVHSRLEKRIQDRATSSHKDKRDSHTADE